ncbi:somatostatin receptor type 4-like [Montipora capricornis]|uniref:somatostatin receptor type 4-like n=1 Tax=Montipora foliosa TaxID=591990 RepID=UPI0035F1203B
MTSGFDIVLLTLFSILETICITFNVILCVAMYRSKSLTIPMNNLIFNLAISDIMIGLWILPRHVFSEAFRHPTGKTGDFLCKFITGSGVLWTSSTASGFLLIAIAVERFTSIRSPNQGTTLTSLRLKTVVAICWITAAAANLPTMVVFAYDEQTQFCVEEWPHWISPKAYVACVFFLGTSSVVVMFILYSQIIFILWKRQRVATEISQAARIRARKNLTRLLVLVTAVHTVCRIPNYTTYLLTYFPSSITYGSNVYNLTVLLILLNSTLHPFMLLSNVQGFRRPFFLLSCHHHCNRVAVEPESEHVVQTRPIEFYLREMKS